MKPFKKFLYESQLATALDAWPPTYDLTGDFIGQGPGSKIKKITSLDQIKY